MPSLLILYGTTDGHTARIARFLADECQRHGVGADVVKAGSADPDPRDYDGIVVAASLHARGFQRAVIRWATAHSAALGDKPGAFLAVCLAVLQPDLAVQRDLIAITNGFELRTGWKPSRVKLVAGALRYTRYGWLKRAVMKRIAAKAGGDTDTRRDHEYTDWQDLGDFAGGFCAQFAAPVRAPGHCEVCSCTLG